MKPEQLKKLFISHKYKIDNSWVLFCHGVNLVFCGNKVAVDKLYAKRINQLKKEYLKDDIWDFKGIRLPVYKKDVTTFSTYLVYLDSLLVYCKCDDNYDHSIVDQLDVILPEGTYGYTNSYIDVTVKENDIVIDAGAWIGDFSAYASIKGARVYAFEPTNETVEYLKKTQEMNRNIHIVEKGLGDKPGMLSLMPDLSSSGSNKVVGTNDKSTTKIEITTIDDFVDSNQLKRVDFIKADIEGSERNMLLGATRTLKQFAPKLAICTYHLPDDPEVLSKIILDANPDYTIVQKKKKLYAMVNCRKQK